MKSKTSPIPRILILTLTILVLLNLAIFGWNARPLLEQRGITIPFLPNKPAQSPELTDTPSPTASPLPLDPTDTAVPISMIDYRSSFENLRAQGVMLLSLRDGNAIHLFAFHPLYLPLTRITNQPWDDCFPSLSSDGTRIAYSSRQNGYWDLYILDLVSGKQERLTDTPEFEGASTWSPDGQWIAYERYNGVSLDIYLQSLTDLTSPPIQLTNDPGIDSSPAWSPKGREIAFVSTRGGDEDIWLARLDHIDDRFVNISHSMQSQDRNPAWSTDGNQLAWAAQRDGDRQIAIWNPDQFDHPARLIGEGDRATWSPDGADIFSEVRDAQASWLAAYKPDSGRLSMPLSPMPGSIYGMIWLKGPLVGWLAEKIENPDNSPAPPLWQPALTRTVVPAGRMGLVPLSDVTAPQALLHDAVDESFTALRNRIAIEAGIHFPAWRTPMYP
ncbi:MAG: PD40 domain-containing protein [Anaerolineaceae bacterium]|nr:PD40 domain-containing protein [Anaerolineaceae bacterium]